MSEASEADPAVETDEGIWYRPLDHEERVRAKAAATLFECLMRWDQETRSFVPRGSLTTMAAFYLLDVVVQDLDYENDKWFHPTDEDRNAAVAALRRSCS